MLSSQPLLWIFLPLGQVYIFNMGINYLYGNQVISSRELKESSYMLAQNEHSREQSTCPSPAPEWLVSAPSAFPSCCIHSTLQFLYLSQAALPQACWHLLHTHSPESPRKLTCLLGIISNFLAEECGHLPPCYPS